ncbi:MAG: NAD(P)-dependent oxidoreductase [Cryomorphaceae bacterium]
MKVLIIDTIHEALVLKLRQAGFTCEILPEEKRTVDDVRRMLTDCQGLVLRSGISVDRALIDANPQLAFIGRVGAGLEHIQVQYARDKGVEVLSSPEGNRQAVAEHALGSLLSLFNRLHIADHEVRNGTWLRKQNEGEELQGKTVAIVGFGNTGSAFGKLLSGFQVEVLTFDKYKDVQSTKGIEQVGMEEVYRRADVVSLHLPYNDETHHLVDADWISSFERPFYLINTSRGGIVHSEDLLKALETGRVKGACLDVLEYETQTLTMPAFEDLPETARKLMNHSNVLLSPHIAGLTRQSFEKLSSILADKIIARFKPA